MLVDDELNLYTLTNAYDPLDPNIIGASDVLVTKFDPDGEMLWRSYYGGTSFDFPKGFVLTSDNGIALIANTESTDFDVEEHHGYQDIWLVKLEELTTSNEEEQALHEFALWPNPATDFIQINNLNKISAVHIIDAEGRQVMNPSIINNMIPISSLPSGIYFVKLEDTASNTHIIKLAKN
jgi:hypothetical protein